MERIEKQYRVAIRESVRKFTSGKEGAKWGFEPSHGKLDCLSASLALLMRTALVLSNVRSDAGEMRTIRRRWLVRDFFREETS